jgi:DNA-binding HxlR family transcriptional regulator
VSKLEAVSHRSSDDDGFNLGEAFCPDFHHAVELIGRRWTGAILRALLHGATRFGQLRDVIPELTDKMLAARLKELEAEGILTRTVVPETPVRVVYDLTDKGRDLSRTVEALSEWADRWAADSSSSRTP